MFCIPVSEIINTPNVIKSTLIVNPSQWLDNPSTSSHIPPNKPYGSPYYYDKYNNNYFSLSTDSSESKGFAFDLRDKCAVFKNFYNGRLLVVGNNYFFVNDLEDGNENFALTESKYNSKIIMEFFQEEIIKDKKVSATGEHPYQITILGTGRNGYGSVFAVNDFIGNGTVFNLNLKNKLTSNDTESLENFKFLESPEILLEMYMNDKNKKNEIIFSKEYTAGIMEPVYLGSSGDESTDSTVMVTGNLPGAVKNGQINNGIYTREVLSGNYHYYPHLNKNLTSTSIQGWKFNGQEVSNIIYNTAPGYHYDTTSIILWARQDNNKTLNITNPLFSLYNNDNINNQCNPGFYIDTRRNLLV
jgi:hypothetical protein